MASREKHPPPLPAYALSCTPPLTDERLLGPLLYRRPRLPTLLHCRCCPVSLKITFARAYTSVSTSSDASKANPVGPRQLTFRRGLLLLLLYRAPIRIRRLLGLAGEEARYCAGEIQIETGLRVFLATVGRIGGQTQPVWTAFYLHYPLPLRYTLCFPSYPVLDWERPHPARPFLRRSRKTWLLNLIFVLTKLLRKPLMNSEQQIPVCAHFSDQFNRVLCKRPRTTESRLETETWFSLASSSLDSSTSSCS